MNNGIKGPLFDKFEILDVLKKDEHAAVYLAQHLFLGKNIILKTLNTSNLSDTSVLERFKREAKLLAQLEHPNIIKVLDFGTAENFFYISFEYFRSRNLRDVILKGKPDNERKRALLIQLLKGIGRAHEEKIIHRDIKPDNILVDEYGHLKIADFGLAFAENDPLITNKSSIVGTPGYMAPEQITGEKLTYQSDLFSIGVVAYELYTGNNPFIRQDINSTINAILSYDEKIFEPLSQAPENEAAIIKKAMSRKKESRPQSCAEMLAELGEPPSGADNNKNKPAPTIKKKTVISGGLILFFAIAVFVFLRYSDGGERQNQTTPLQTRLNTAAGDTSVFQTDEAKNTGNEGNAQITKSSPGEAPSEAELTSPSYVDGRLSIDCIPWALVYLDSIRLDNTPVTDYRRIAVGKHTLRFLHPDFPAYATTVIVPETGILDIKVRLEEVFGAVTFEVSPWGEIILGGRNYGATPLGKPIYLPQGKHTVIIKNPALGEGRQTISVRKGESTTVKYAFQEQQ